MVQLSANLTTLFKEHDFLARFKVAAKVGFKGVEYQFPYQHPKQVIAELLAEHGLKQAMFNIPAGNWDEDERGIACFPHRQEEYRDGVKLALEYAQALNCTKLTVLAGRVPHGSPDREHFVGQLISNLDWTADTARKAGVTILFEALNTNDVPDYLVSDTATAHRIIQDASCDNLYLQHDLYHMQIMEGDLVNTLKKYIASIGHIQIADNPGRHEPGTGEINYNFVLSELDKLGYRGWVGCEYNPAGDTVKGLSWAKKYL